MSSQLTILIPTSPIPAHPSTLVLDECIYNLRKFTDAKIIIMADGVHESLKHREADYRHYISNVQRKIGDSDYGDCKIEIFEHHTHQARMTWHALVEIETPLVMFVEHDTYIAETHGKIPFQEICDMVEGCGTVNCIRFNIFDRVLDEHGYLMLGPDTACGIPIQRTIQWSQRPHIARTEWYMDVLRNHFRNDEKTMIEDVMHGVVQDDYAKTGVDNFHLAIYTPEGNQLRSYHSDARGSDEKIITG